MSLFANATEQEYCRQEFLISGLFAVHDGRGLTGLLGFKDYFQVSEMH
jgi:hypothetical protein